MKRPAVIFALAALLFVAHWLAGIAGWAEHTSVIAGMPQAEVSWVYGPAFVGLHLAFVVLAPVLAIAGTFDTLLLLSRASGRIARSR
jgi:hypothetical protein